MNQRLLDEMHADLRDDERCQNALNESDIDRMYEAEQLARAVAAWVALTPMQRAAKQLEADAFYGPEDLGVIDPATKEVFLAAVLFEHGRNDFLEIFSDGTVQVPARLCPVEPSEARALRGYVQKHNEWVSAMTVNRVA